MKAFISYKYDHEPSENLAQQVWTILDALGLEPVTGKKLVATHGLNDQIERLIEGCDLLVAIRYKDAPSSYVADEIGIAKARGITPFYIADDPATIGGLQSHHFIIPATGATADLYAHIVRTVVDFQRKRSSGSSTLPVSSEGAKLGSPFVNPEMAKAFSAMEFREDLSKERYHYGILLEQHRDPALAERFYLAYIDIRFSTVLIEREIIVDAAKTVDNLQVLYESMVEDRSSIYRYILKTDSDIKLSNDVFEITRATMNNTIPLKPVQVPSGSSQHLRFQCIPEQGGLIDEHVGKTVSFDIRIRTIVDKRRNEYTVIFGYPVHHAETSFLQNGTDIRNVDIVGVITSPAPLEKSPIEGAGRIGARASVRGWLFPDSAIVYVWQRSQDL